MTILPRKTSFLSGLAGGASEGVLYNVQNKLQMQSFQRALQGFRDYFQGGQGGISGATEANPMAVYGEPGQNPMMGGGAGMGGEQQNPMSIFSALGQGVGGMGRGVEAGLGGLARILGGMGRGIGGMFGQRRPQPVGGMPMMPSVPQPAQGMGPVNPNYMDPRIMMMLQQLLGGRMGMF